MKRLASVLAIALVAASATARADDIDKPAGATGDAAKPMTAEAASAIASHYPPPSTRLKIIAAGLFVTAASWGLAFAVSRGWQQEPCVITVAGSVYPNTLIPCASGPPGAAQLGIPIVGPWLALGVSGCAVDEPSCTVAKPILRGVGYVLNGVAQIGGLGLVAEALIMRTEAAVDPLKKTSPLALRAGPLELRPVPVISPSMSGLGLTGTF